MKYYCVSTRLYKDVHTEVKVKSCECDAEKNLPSNAHGNTKKYEWYNDFFRSATDAFEDAISQFSWGLLDAAYANQYNQIVNELC